MNIKSLFLAFLFLLISGIASNAQQSQPNFIKHKEDLYIFGNPNTSEKLYVYGGRKVKTIKSNKCGALIFPVGTSDESVPIDIKDEAGFSLSITMNDIYNSPEKALSSCINGIFQEPESGILWANNLNPGSNVLVAILQPNKVYFLAYTGSVTKNIKFNSCGFAKIKKPNSIENPLFGIADAELKHWNDVEERKPDLCLNNQRYIPYN